MQAQQQQQMQVKQQQQQQQQGQQGQLSQQGQQAKPYLMPPQGTLAAPPRPLPPQGVGAPPLYTSVPQHQQQQQPPTYLSGDIPGAARVLQPSNSIPESWSQAPSPPFLQV
jgi:hypothetical protein